MVAALVIIALTGVVLVAVKASGNKEEKALDEESYTVGRFISSMKRVDGELS